MQEHAKLVLWDWNGTLINDVDFCVDAVNVLLNKRDMPPIDKQTYKRIFTFPVIEFYKRLEFDFNSEPFDVLAKEYIMQYNIFVKQASLFPKAEMVLEYLKSKGYRQSILSAMSQSDLERQIEDNKILHYFHDIIGLQNIFAESKVQNAIAYIQNSGFHKNEVFIIGDTYHDYEVSKNIGCKCILISNGHQFLDQNIVPDAILLSNITEICNHFQ